MKVGDLVQVKQIDLAIHQAGEEPQPMTFWLYATVLEVLADGAFVEIAHPGNLTHGDRKKVLRADLRTHEEVQAEHDAHPQARAEKLDFNRLDHRHLNNLRVALARMKPAPVPAGAAEKGAAR